MSGTSRRSMARLPEPEVMDSALEARAYEEGDFRRVNLGFARRLCRLLPRRGGHALDLGTGPAAIPILFCHLAPGWRVTAIDASPAMLRLARQAVRRAGLQARIRLLRGDAKALGKLGQSFDVIFSNSLLHHLLDPVPFWREIRRVVKPGGTVLVQDLRRPESRAAVRRLVRLHAQGASPLLRELFRRSLLAAFTTPEVRRQLGAAGLGALRVRATTDRHLVVAGKMPGRLSSRSRSRRAES